MASKIPEEDWKIIKKYTKGKIFRQFSEEESLQKSNKDLFLTILVLIIFCSYIVIYFLGEKYYNIVDYYSIIALLIPMIIVSSVISLGHYYGKSLKYQTVILILILLLNLVIEYSYIYYTFYFKIPSFLPINAYGFTFFSIIGIILGFPFGTFPQLFFDYTDSGNSKNFKIEVLSHADNLESYERILKNYINHVIDLKILPSYDANGKKIIQQVGFNNPFLLYVISGNIFAFFIFSKKGRHIYQDEKSTGIQKKISFLLKNSLNFKDASEEQQIEAKENCLDLLSQYEKSDLALYIGTHRKETLWSIFAIVLAVIALIVYQSYPLDIILQKFKEIISNTIIPLIVTLIVTLLFYSFLGKQTK